MSSSSANLDGYPFEPDEVWKLQLKQRVEDGLLHMVKDAEETRAAELRKDGVNSKDCLRLEDEYKQTMNVIKALADRKYREDLNHERHQRRLAAHVPIQPDWTRVLNEQQQSNRQTYGDGSSLLTNFHQEQQPKYTNDHSDDLPPLQPTLFKVLPSISVDDWDASAGLSIEHKPSASGSSVHHLSNSFPEFWNPPPVEDTTPFGSPNISKREDGSGLTPNVKLSSMQPLPPALHYENDGQISSSIPLIYQAYNLPDPPNAPFARDYRPVSRALNPQNASNTDERLEGSNGVHYHSGYPLYPLSTTSILQRRGYNEAFNPPTWKDWVAENKLHRARAIRHKPDDRTEAQRRSAVKNKFHSGNAEDPKHSQQRPGLQELDTEAQRLDLEWKRADARVRQLSTAVEMLMEQERQLDEEVQKLRGEVDIKQRIVDGGPDVEWNTYASGWGTVDTAWPQGGEDAWLDQVDSSDDGKGIDDRTWDKKTEEVLNVESEKDRDQEEGEMLKWEEEERRISYENLLAASEVARRNNSSKFAVRIKHDPEVEAEEVLQRQKQILEWQRLPPPVESVTWHISTPADHLGISACANSAHKEPENLLMNKAVGPPSAELRRISTTWGFTALALGMGGLYLSFF